MSKSKFSKTKWMADNRFTMLSLFLVIIMFVVVKLQYPDGVGPTVKEPEIGELGGKFNLEMADGESFTNADLLNKFTLLYFGYTFCPDVCPTALLTMLEARDKLPENISKNLQLAFVSVDPKRDTPEVLKNYVSAFGDNIIGATASEEEIARVADEYGVYYGFPQGKSDEYYVVDHSTFVYLMGPDGAFLYRFNYNDDANVMAAKLKELTFK